MKCFGDLCGKTVMITGSTGGLGRETCLRLAACGADLHLLDRNPVKSKALQNEIKQKFPNIKISSTTLDLNDIVSVKEAAEALQNIKADVLILNAAIYKVPREILSSGYDNVFTVNFLSHYYLLRELMPALRANKTRVIALSSIAHRYDKTDPDDIDFRNRKSCEKVYGNSKRYLMYSLFELFKNETEVTLSVVHPGIAFTNITAHYPKLIFAIIKYPMKVIFMSPKTASKCVMAGIFQKTDYGEWIGPEIFDIWGRPELKRVKTDPNETARIYQTSEELYQKLKKETII